MIGELSSPKRGETAADAERELGVPKHTIYAWKAKYGGLEVKERSGYPNKCRLRKQPSSSAA
jgi:hypothetical protein